MTSMSPVPTGWYPDPFGRHQNRFWDGARWTEQVADAGILGFDPVAPVRPLMQTTRGPRAWLIAVIALGAVGLLVVTVLAVRGGNQKSTATQETSTTESTVPESTTATLAAPLTAGPVADWEGTEVKVVCLTITQEIPQVPDYAYPVAEWIDRMLQPVGITAVEPGQPCDATLDVSLYFEARPGQYDAYGTTVTIYAGMLRRFDMTLTAPGRSLAAFSNTTDVPAPDITPASGPRTPQEALDKWADVFRKFTINGLTRIWPPAAIEALRDDTLAFDADQALRDVSNLGRPDTPPSPDGYAGWRDWYEKSLAG